MKDAREFVFDCPALEGTAMLVMLVIADWANDETGWTRPRTQAELAARAHITTRTLQRVCKQLKADGHLVTDAGQGKASRYGVAGYIVKCARNVVSETPEMSEVDAPNVVSGMHEMSHVDARNVGSTYDKTGADIRQIVHPHGKPSLPSFTVSDPEEIPEGKVRASAHDPAPNSPDAQSAEDSTPALENDTIAMMQADVYIRAYEAVYKAAGAPQTVKRTHANKLLAAQWYRDGYTVDELRAAVQESIDAGYPVAFTFVAERMAKARLPRPVAKNGAAARSSERDPFMEMYGKPASEGNRGAADLLNDPLPPDLAERAAAARAAHPSSFKVTIGRVAS